MKKKSRFFSARYITLTFVLFALAIFILIFFTNQVSQSVERESKQITRDAIIRALVTCYATEGSYPAKFSHIEEYYGVTVDYNRYIVDYEVFASNVMPEISLIDRK